MSKEGILRYNYKPFSLQKDVFHMTKKKKKLSIIMEDVQCMFTSVWMPGTFVVQ